MNRGRLAGILALAGALVFLTLGGCAGTDSEESGNPSSGGEQLLDIRGSDTMVNLGAALAEAYMDDNPDVDLVVQGGGSGTGIAAVLNHNADIAQASRAMSDEEWEKAEDEDLDLHEITVAYDALAVVVHPDNPVNELTLEDIGAIYRGDIKNWKEVGGDDEEIVLLSRDTTSGTFVFFREAVVRQGDRHPDAEYHDDAMFMPSTQAIVDELAQNRAAIGYIGLGYLSPSVQELSLAVDGESFSPTGDPSGYPLRRPLYFYIAAGQMDDLIEDYVEFVLSEAGQKVVRELDFLPVPD